jgi:hypothetical protein
MFYKENSDDESDEEIMNLDFDNDENISKDDDVLDEARSTLAFAVYVHLISLF